MASKLEDALRIHQHRRSKEIKLFGRLICRENDALGDLTWLGLGKGEKELILGDHLLVDQFLSLGRMESMINMNGDLSFLVKEASRILL